MKPKIILNYSFQIKNLEEILTNTKMECSQRLGPINKVLLNLQSELKKVRSQVEHQAETNRALVGVKMKLEDEIRAYQDLINRMTASDDR